MGWRLPKLQLIESKLANHARNSEDMAVGQGRFDDRVGRPRRLPSQRRLEGHDLLGRQPTQVGQGARFNLAVFTVALAQEDRRLGVSVRDRRDEHTANIHSKKHMSISKLCSILHANAKKRLYPRKPAPQDSLSCNLGEILLNFGLEELTALIG